MHKNPRVQVPFQVCFSVDACPADPPGWIPKVAVSEVTPRGPHHLVVIPSWDPPAPGMCGLASHEHWQKRGLIPSETRL